MSSRLVVASRRVVLPDGVFDRGILIEDGSISEILPAGRRPRGTVVDDYGQLVLMPALIDTHVHINQPGRTSWEGFRSATAAAAAGGVTTLIDMPLNSRPVTVDQDALVLKREAASGRLHVDCGFYGGLIPGSEPDLDRLIDDGVFGIKAFLIDSGLLEFPPATPELLTEAAPSLIRSGLPLLVHCEIDEEPDRPPGRSRRYQDYLESRPPRMETQAIESMISLAASSGCRVHIVHISAARSLARLEAARKRGLPVSTETCPHYLYFSAERISDGDTRWKCAPPIREDTNREQLWKGLLDGVIDMVVSDHSPCPPGMKRLQEGDFFGAWGGVASLQLGLPVVWTEARRRGCSPADPARWMSLEPARLVGLDSTRGCLAPGLQADLVVWDPEKSFTVKQDLLYDRHRFSPYLGERLFGRVEATYLNGRVVFSREQGLVGAAGGRILRRQ